VVSNAVLAIALYQTGDFDKGKAYMSAIISAITEGVFGVERRGRWSLVAACFCYVSDETDLLTEVEAAARDAIADPGLPPLWALEAEAALALVAALRHEASTAAEPYAALKPYANTVTQTGAVCTGRLLGLLAHTMGKLDTAQTHFEDALAFCRKADYRPELAWTCHDYAKMLLDRAVGAHSRAPLHTDRQKASALVEEGLSIASELGMKPLVERLETLREKLVSLPPGKTEYPDGLTEREVEVLRLVAAGMSNSEIAEKLVLSIRTVERHISNIYSKTDTHGRADATAFAFTHGLIPPANRTT
jgi:ATP/maltotriose-dependent transcriptional regulator MalT